MRISDWSSDVCSSDLAHIVNTGSIAGLVALPERGVYAATKYAVVAISETLRIELAPHDIGVTVICPGSVRTRILGASRNRPTELQATNVRSVEQTSELQSLMRISYAVFCLKKKTITEQYITKMSI